MPADPEPTLSPETLAGLFAGALRVGVKVPPPDPPDWMGEGDFPLVIESYVGRGGSGFVWKASRRDGYGPVALKLVPFRGDPLRLRERWENECTALARLDHPNLIHLVNHGLAPDGDSGWLAMEWVEGRSLDIILSEQNRLPFSAALEFLSQIGGALNALHGAGLVHRDVKPGNCLRDEVNARWVLADLGIALDLGKAEDHRVTRTQERPATPGYSPPELDLQGHAPAPFGDQYSLAFTLWEMLAGNRPLGAFPRLHTLCKCPEGIDGVLRRALATDPANRFPDLTAFEKAFQKAASRPPRSYFLIGILAALSIAAALFWLSRPPTFPKRFQSGRIQVNEGREHHMRIDMTLQHDGRFLAKIRTTCLDPFFGFDGRTHLIFRDAKGEIVHTLITHGYGVNGRFIPGGKHDRLDDWKCKIPPEAARRVASVNFLAAPSAGTLEKRAALNHKEFHKDLKSIKSGAVSGLDALSKMFSPIPPKKKDPPAHH